MATHSVFLPKKVPWTEKPGGLQSQGSQRVRHDWVTKHTSTSLVCPLRISRGFSSGAGKESICQCRRWGSNPWVRKIPWRRKWQPTLVFLPGKFHVQRRLMGYKSMESQRVRHNWATGHRPTGTHRYKRGWRKCLEQREQQKQKPVAWQQRNKRSCGQSPVNKGERVYLFQSQYTTGFEAGQTTLECWLSPYPSGMPG